MIFLTGTTKKLQLATSSAATVDVVVDYIESVAATGVTAAIGSQETAISSATTTDICATASASNIRNVTQITVRNKDASLSCDVTVIIDVSATDYELHKVTLGTGDMLQYIEGVGFFVQTVTAKLNKMLYVTSDSTHPTAATFAGITGLSLPVKSGRVYAFEACLHHISNATTTGAQFALGGVAVTFMIAGEIGTILNSATAGTYASGVVTAVDTAIIVETTGAAANAPSWIGGTFQPSADGTMLLKATSEVTVASGLIVKKGSWWHVRETDN